MAMKRKMTLTKDEAEVAYLLFNGNPEQGNSLKLLRQIDPVMTNIEKMREDKAESITLLLFEGLYQVLKDRLEGSKGWRGQGRAFVMAFSDKMDNAEKVEDTEK